MTMISEYLAQSAPEPEPEPCPNGRDWCEAEDPCGDCLNDREADRDFDEFWDENGPEVADNLIGYLS